MRRPSPPPEWEGDLDEEEEEEEGEEEMDFRRQQGGEMVRFNQRQQWMVVHPFKESASHVVSMTPKEFSN